MQCNVDTAWEQCQLPAPHHTKAPGFLTHTPLHGRDVSCTINAQLYCACYLQKSVLQKRKKPAISWVSSHCWHRSEEKPSHEACSVLEISGTAECLVCAVNGRRYCEHIKLVLCSLPCFLAEYLKKFKGFVFYFGTFCSWGLRYLKDYLKLWDHRQPHTSALMGFLAIGL